MGEKFEPRFRNPNLKEILKNDPEKYSALLKKFALVIEMLTESYILLIKKFPNERAKYIDMLRKEVEPVINGNLRALKKEDMEKEVNEILERLNLLEK